jgi:hypothetical protein
MTTQQMIDTAAEEGAAIVALWSMSSVERFSFKCTDNGAFYFVDTAEHRIDQNDARRLLDCFQTGYID